MLIISKCNVVLLYRSFSCSRIIKNDANKWKRLVFEDSKNKQQNEDDVKWQTMNEKTRFKPVRPNYWHGNKEKNVEFQATLKQYVKEIESDSLDIKPLHKGISIDTCQHRYARLLLGEQHEKYEEVSNEISLDDATLREMARQQARFIEMPGRLKMPECEFESFSGEQVKLLLKNRDTKSSNFNFLLHKCAIKDNKRQKTKSKESEKEDGEESYRSNMVPYHNVAKDSRVACDWRLLSGAPVDNPIIFDMGFQNLMSRKCLVDLVGQINMVLNYNTQVQYPLPILFANLAEESFFYQRMKGANSHGFPNDGWMSVTEKKLNKLDGIPLESLIYLSPDATETMQHFEEDKLYIIGGLVDMGPVQKEKSSLLIAKELGIKRQRLPLSSYLMWGNRSGRRSLSLDIVFRVMMEIRSTGNWAKALQHIPSRLHTGLTELGLEELEKTRDNELLKWYQSIYPYQHMISKPATTVSYEYLGWDTKKKY